MGATSTLAESWRASGESTREEVLLEHLPHVRKIARRIHDRLPPQVPIEDLVHAGVLGLMDAVRKFDPARNVRLKHYAEFRIRGAILDSLRGEDWSPRALRREARRLARIASECRARLGRDPSETELAKALGLRLEEFQQLRAELRGLDLASMPTEDPHADSQESGRPSPREQDPFSQTLRGEMATLLESAMDALPEREREVLALYHFEELTMKEVGLALGIGESRVSQIHSSALARLRGLLQGAA